MIRQCKQNQVSIFIDVSNIACGIQWTESTTDRKFSTYLNIKTLIEIVVGLRTQRRVVAAGSSPPLNHTFWRQFGDKAEINVLPRNPQPDGSSVETGVDEILHQAMLADVQNIGLNLDEQTMILVSGDGNDNYGRATSFLTVVNMALDKGWKIEIWGWQRTISRSYHDDIQQRNPKALQIFYLDTVRSDLIYRHTPRTEQREFEANTTPITGPVTETATEHSSTTCMSDVPTLHRSHIVPYTPDSATTNAVLSYDLTVTQAYNDTNIIHDIGNSSPWPTVTTPVMHAMATEDTTNVIIAKAASEPDTSSVVGNQIYRDPEPSLQSRNRRRKHRARRNHSINKTTTELGIECHGEHVSDGISELMKVTPISSNPLITAFGEPPPRARKKRKKCTGSTSGNLTHRVKPTKLT